MGVVSVSGVAIVICMHCIGLAVCLCVCAESVVVGVDSLQDLMVQTLIEIDEVHVVEWA